MSNPVNTPAKRALIFDDDVDLSHLVEHALTKIGVSVKLASTFEDFKRSYSEKIELILFDLVNSDTDGIEILRYLAERHSSAVLILMSSADVRIIRAAARLADAHELRVGGTLTKPFRPEAMTQLVSAIDFRAIRGGADTEVLVSHRAMRSKIENNALNVIYQPKVRLNTGEISGVEALIRWPNSTGPHVSTPSLIYVAEKADLIDRLTIQVLERGLADLSLWAESGIDIRLSVNVSPRSLNNDEFVAKILAITREFSIPAPRIVFEVTEKAFSSNLILPLENLSRLGLKGFGISIDDFGTGHSSFERMNLVPFNELKLDKSFVLSIRNDPQSYEIVRSALELGKRLGVDVVAEGVESAEIWNELRRLGCDVAQGYFISTGIDGADYPEWSRDWKRRTAERADFATEFRSGG